ncbi:MAG: D-alanyl-D-alanine carboxypeptidase, partial [bacterium]|nr:D-alanyl-D-alanine carboxypeptidase [bacterium]
VAEFARPLETVVKHILTTSDNLAAEMVFKVAGAKYAEEKTPLKTGLNTFGTTQNGINMFFDYYEKLGLDIKQVKLRDGSGVSRYNAMNANWMTNALLKMNLDYEKYLPTSGEGTLLKRMREMKDSVYFKTGTLFGTSSLAGVIKSGDNEYYWASVIMSYNRNKSLIKGIEDEMVYEVYRAGENE